MSRHRETDLFAIVAESATEGPILLEAEGQMTSREDAVARLYELTKPGSHWIRACVVRLEYEVGNAALLPAMEAMQRGRGPEDLP